MTDDEIALWLITKGTLEDKPVMSLAADRILTLRAERDEAWAYMSAAQGDLYDASMMEAERDRLQSALQHIVTYLAEPTNAADDTINSLRGDLRFVSRVARAALKGETL